jgi:hypothetical protein
MIQGYPLKIDYEACYRKPSEPLETVLELPDGKKGKTTYLKGYLHKTNEGFYILAPGMETSPYIWIPGKDARKAHLYRVHDPDLNEQNLNLVLPDKIKTVLEMAAYEKDMIGKWHLICNYKVPKLYLAYLIDITPFPNITCELGNISWQNPSSQGNTISKVLLTKNGNNPAIVFEVPKLLDNFGLYYEPSLSDKGNSEDQIYQLRPSGRTPEMWAEKIDDAPPEISRIDLERICEEVIKDMKLLSEGAPSKTGLKNILDYMDVLKEPNCEY